MVPHLGHAGAGGRRILVRTGLDAGVSGKPSGWQVTEPRGQLSCCAFLCPDICSLRSQCEQEAAKYAIPTLDVSNPATYVQLVVAITVAAI